MLKIFRYLFIFNVVGWVSQVFSYTVDREPNIIESFRKKIYFAATTRLTGNELFRSDGTQDGTSIFLDAANGTRSSFPLHLFVFQDT